MSYDLKAAVGWITAIAVIISVSTYVLSLLIGVAIITSTQLGMNVANLTGPLFLAAFLLFFETPFQANASWLVILSLVIFVVCFIKAATANGGFLSGLRLLLPGSRPRTLPNWLAIMPVVGSSLFVIVLALTLIQSSVGTSTGNLNCPLGTPPETCAAELFAGIVTAPVAEEIGFRITAIGLVVAILVAVKLGNNVARGAKLPTSQQLVSFFSAFISPGYAKEKAGLSSIRTGGLKGISKTEWSFLLITSAVFGVYHVLGGGGWGPGKFLTAALSGFALGVVYLAYGAFADILLHWFFNFYFEVFYVYTGFDGVFSTFGYPLVALGTFALGVWGIIIGIYWIAKWKSSRMIPTGFTIP